jgi:hypothetical protein
MTERVFSILRSIGGSGGTVVSRAIAACGALVLSETNPRSACLMNGALNPLLQLQKLRPDLVPSAFASTDFHTLANPTIFGTFISEVADNARKAGVPLVVRDYSYIDFLGVPFACPMAGSSLNDALKDRGHMCNALIIRHPVDNYNSLIRHVEVNGLLTPEGFIDGYLDFVRTFVGSVVIRFEDFTLDPAIETGRLCAALNVPYRADWQDHFSGAGVASGHSRGLSDHIITDTTRSNQAERQSAELRLNRVQRYSELLSLTGYEPLANLEGKPRAQGHEVIADRDEKDRLTAIASLYAAAERARADGEEKDRLIAYLHSEAAARLTIIERLEAELRNSLARNQELEALTARIEEIEADRAERLRMIETLTAHIQEIDADRAERLQLVEDLSYKVFDLEQRWENRKLRRKLERAVRGAHSRIIRFPAIFTARRKAGSLDGEQKQ